MEQEFKVYKEVFIVRKGGENGEKRFITLGNVMLSTKLHDTEEEAVEELENFNLETIARIIVSVMNACNNMIEEKFKNETK